MQGSNERFATILLGK